MLKARNASRFRQNVVWWHWKGDKMNKEFFKSKDLQKCGTQISMLTHEDRTTIENTTEVLCIAMNFNKNLLNVEVDGEVSEIDMDAIMSVWSTYCFQ